VIFDTDILVWYLRKRAEAATFLERVPPAERNVSTITYLELLYGCLDRGGLRDVQEFVSGAFSEVVPITEAISETARQIMERFALSHRPDVTDVLIAATALKRGEVVATGNVKHFDFIPGLAIKPFRP
jgi:predicted nucleic acid-binding protein